MAFDAAERNGKFGRIQCQISKESSSRAKRKRRVVLCRRTVRVKVKRKVIPASFLKIEGRGDARWGERPEKEGWSVELVGYQNTGPESPPRSKKGRERIEQRRCQGRSNGKSTYERIIEGEEVRGDNPIGGRKYLLNPTWGDGN